MDLILIISFSTKVAHEIRERLDLETLVDGGRVVSKKSIRKSQKHLAGGDTMSRWGKEQETNALVRKCEPLNLGEMFLLHFFFYNYWELYSRLVGKYVIAIASNEMFVIQYVSGRNKVLEWCTFWPGVLWRRDFNLFGIWDFLVKMHLKQFQLPIYMAVKQMWGTLPRVTLVLLSHVKRLNRL